MCREAGWGEVLGMLMPGPDTRVVELRIHGLGRADPAAAVGGQTAVDIAGDGLNRLVRPADRLLRPAPGPVLLADGHPVPRIVEAYLWDGLRPGAGRTLLWALLLPFALANAAYWALPSTGAYTHLETAVRAVVRVCALLLTAALAVQLGVLTLDVLAGQCLAAGSGCLPAAWHPPQALRGLVGLLPAGLAVLGLHRLAEARVPLPARLADYGLDAVALGAEPASPALRALHTTTALAAVAWLATGGAAGAAPGRGWLWSAELAELVLCLVATALADPSPDPDRQPRDRWMWRALIAGATLTLALAAVLAPVSHSPGPGPLPSGPSPLPSGPSPLPSGPLPSGPLPSGPGPLPGSQPTMLALAAVGAGGALLLAGMLGLLIRRARPGWRRLPEIQHPWLGGWLALVLLVLAGYLVAGVPATAILAARGLIGGAATTSPPAGQQALAAWGLAGIVLAVAAGFVALRVYRGRPEHPMPELDTLHPHATRALRRTWQVAALFRANLPHAALLACVALLTTTVAGAAWPGGAPPQWLVVLGAAVLTATVLGAAGVGWVVDRRPGAPRRLTLLHDLVTGWPRTAHPIGPPPAVLKALTGLVDRARQHLADSGTRLVLVGEGYGSVLATLAASRLLSRLDPVDVARLGLVTVGSPVQWGYQRGFPAAVPPTTLTGLSRALGPRWRALCRGTDPGGGAVTTWSSSRFGGELLGIGMRPDGSMGPLKPATRGRHGAVVLGGDHWLTDPQDPPPADRRWHPGLLRNADYASDAEWDAAIAVAAGLVAAGTVRKRRAPVSAPGGPARMARSSW